jgi:hypothetical protein
MKILPALITSGLEGLLADIWTISGKIKIQYNPFKYFVKVLCAETV